MNHPRLKSADDFWEEEMKDPEFRRMYEIERIKVSLAQKIAELRDALHQKYLARSVQTQ